MSHDPYAAPRVLVGDIAIAQAPRPRSVNVAMVLIGLNIVSAAAFGIAELQRYSFRGQAIIVPIFCVELIVVLGILFAIARGKSWGRLIFSVGITAVFFVYAYKMWHRSALLPDRASFFTAPKELVSNVIPFMFDFIAIYLLFVPGRDWFRPRKE